MHKILLCFSLLLTVQFCQAEDQIKIGAVYSLSGFGAHSGNSELGGVRLAIDEINAQGGIAGKKVTLIVDDNHSDLRRTAESLNKLININKVQFILGPNWAEFTEVALPIAERNHIPLITASGTKTGLFKGREYCFTLMPEHGKSIKKYADYIIAKKPLNVVLIQTRNAFYDELSDNLKKYLEAAQIEVLSFEHDPTDIDYRSTLTKITIKKPDLIIAMMLEGASTVNFLKQYRDLHLQPPLYYGTSLPYEKEITDNLIQAEGVYFFNYKLPPNSDFVSRFRQAYKEPPIAGADRAYDSVYLIKHAAETCGMESENLARCIRETKFNGISQFISFDPDGVVLPDGEVIEIFQVQHARIVKIG